VEKCKTPKDHVRPDEANNLIMKSKTITLLLSITLVSCTYSDNGDSVDQDRLTGRYVYQPDKGDTLDVHASGTYDNYTWLEGKKLTNTGAWRYDSIKGRIVFENFSFLGDKVSRGFWDTKVVEKENGIQLLHTPSDLSGYFLRIDSIRIKKRD
jgi:hypothetical protein